MNKIINLIVAMAALTFCFSCNNEWEDEQFAHYVGFKAPINSDGCTTVYVRYKADGSTVKYQLPLVVSGSTVHGNNINAVVELDPDSLLVLNQKNIGERRMDIWYKDLSDAAEHGGKDRVITEFPATVQIPAGESTAMLDIELDLSNLNQSHRWILPLRVAENKPGYTANTRKHYNNALLHVVPFNDYSGTYVASGMQGRPMNGGVVDQNAIPYTVSDKILYATGDKTAFFYAGGVDHTNKQRDQYRVDVEFCDAGALKWSASNPDLEFSVKAGSDSYLTPAEPDALKPYLLRKSVIIQATYYMLDKTGGVPVKYEFKGTMTMQRTINTQIPDEDQAIQW